MNWSDAFLICFAAGFTLSLFSFAGGTLHLPHLHFRVHGRGGVALFPAVMGFLTWFGGAGYLLVRHGRVSAFLALVLAAGIGLIGSWLLFRLLQRLLNDEQPLSAEDHRMIGVLGQVASPMREGGTGEMIYSLQGTRRGVAARSEDNRPLPRGTEVVVTRFEKGIAYVTPWDELSK